jgi:hypothetical protein
MSTFGRCDRHFADMLDNVEVARGADIMVRDRDRLWMSLFIMYYMNHGDFPRYFIRYMGADSLFDQAPVDLS